MSNSFSAGHEREECRKMNRGFWHSVFGILFCFIPGLGLLFAPKSGAQLRGELAERISAGEEKATARIEAPA